MFRLSGRLRRLMGKRVLEIGGNAVIGFKQYYDLESEKKDITSRAIGTAVKLTFSTQPTFDRGLSWTSLTPGQNSMISPRNTEAKATQIGGSPTRSPNLAPKDSVTSPQELALTPLNIMSPQAANSKLVDPQMLTLRMFPAGCVIGIGGLVSATSVKILDNDEKEVREVCF